MADVVKGEVVMMGDEVAAESSTNAGTEESRIQFVTATVAWYLSVGGDTLLLISFANLH